MLEKGANVDVEDFEKDTPLYVAETVDMAQLLLDHGANPKRVNEEGISPAATAYEEGWDEVAQLLAGITHEKLYTAEEAENPEEDEFSHMNEEEDEELSPELSSRMQEIMQHLQEGDVEDEEKLRELVTKMLLDEMKRSVEDDTDEAKQE